MSNYLLVKQAIQNKQSITCYYLGHLRLMSPHVIGTKNGREQALFYQYGGTSSSGLSSDPNQNWRCIPVYGLTQLSINSDPFQSISKHTQSQTCVDVIDAEVSF